MYCRKNFVLSELSLSSLHKTNSASVGFFLF